jgi:hypothetical protein
MTYVRGTVVSIVPTWPRTGVQPPRPELWLLVEYDTGDGPVLASVHAPPRLDLRVGTRVSVIDRPGGRAGVVFDEPPSWLARWRPDDVVGGLLRYAGVLLLVLLVAGGIWLAVVSRASQLRPIPPPSTTDSSSAGPDAGPS